MAFPCRYEKFSSLQGKNKSMRSQPIKVYLDKQALFILPVVIPGFSGVNQSIPSGPLNIARKNWVLTNWQLLRISMHPTYLCSQYLQTAGISTSLRAIHQLLLILSECQISWLAPRCLVQARSSRHPRRCAVHKDSALQSASRQQHDCKIMQQNSKTIVWGLEWNMTESKILSNRHVLVAGLR